MRLLFIMFVSVLIGVKSLAREKHFILIQTDNKTIFNVAIEGKFYSGNASGFVIIPKLNAGPVDMVVGFAPNTFPDQAFKCTIADKDLGFQLKNFGEKGWGLFNLQTLDVTYSTESTAAKITPPSTGDEPISFDKKPAVVVAPAAQNTTPAAVPDTQVAVVSKPIGDTVLAEVKMKDDTVFPTPTITKLGENKGQNGIDITYADKTTTVADTINLTIPNKAAEADKKVYKDANDSIIQARIALLNGRKDDVRLLEVDMDAKAIDSILQLPPIKGVDSANTGIATLPVGEKTMVAPTANGTPGDSAVAVGKPVKKAGKKKFTLPWVNKKTGEKAPDVPQTPTTINGITAVAPTANDTLGATAPPVDKPRRKKKEKIAVVPAPDTVVGETMVMAPTANDTLGATTPPIPKPRRKKKEKVADVPLPTDVVGTTTPVAATPAAGMGDSAMAVDKKTPVVGKKKEDDLCAVIASESDYTKLRRKMALESTDDHMIREAKKEFRGKCFTTRQIKGLSSLFLNDEGRFRFFTASYSFVSDPEAYGVLQTEFIDPYYVNRFKSMVQ